MIGKGEDATFVCTCGHKERMTKFQERRKRGRRRDEARCGSLYEETEKEAEEPVNNAFAAALKGIKL